MARNVPDELLDKILGKDKVKRSGKDSKGRKLRDKQKKGIVKGNRDAGNRNPRSGRELPASIEEQLLARPGQMPEPQMMGPESPEAQVLNQMLANSPAPVAEQGVDLEDFAQQRQAAWEADETGSEGGFDGETLNMLTEMLDAEGVAQLPAKEIMPILLRDASPEEAAFYDALPAPEKLKILDEIANSDGLGSISSFMPQAPEEQITDTILNKE